MSEKLTRSLLTKKVRKHVEEEFEYPLSAWWDDICVSFWGDEWFEKAWKNHEGVAAYFNGAFGSEAKDLYGAKLWSELSAGYIDVEAELKAMLAGEPGALDRNSRDGRTFQKKLRDVRDIWVSCCEKYKSVSRKTWLAPTGQFRSRKEIRDWVRSVRHDLCITPMLDAYFAGVPANELIEAERMNGNLPIQGVAPAGKAEK